MSDPTQWQAPSGAGWAPPSAPAGWAPPQEPSLPPRPGPAGSGWTPPPKPGLIPLRPLDFGTLLGASFQVLRRNPKPMFGFTVLLTGLTTLIGLAVTGTVAFFAIGRIDAATAEDVDLVTAGSIGSIIVAALVPMVLSMLAFAVLQGIVTLEVARGSLGERNRLPQLWRLAKGRVGALIGWSALVLAVGVLGLVAVAGVIALGAALGGAVGAAVGIAIAVVLGLGMVVLAAWLGTKLSFVPSALVLERRTLREALHRSWSLTAGAFWRILGIQLLVSFIVQTAVSIVTTPLSFIVGMASALIAPNGELGPGAAIAIGAYVLTIVLTIIASSVGYVMQCSVVALLYLDRRMRTEGLDLVLQRTVDARAAGREAEDPFMPEVRRS
ncbi:glycerophosphoryl diester phosphodiesterase membrane domain-containing protein [Arenivirga flava]|uniref:Membrane protein n=1 Tax=Arenivirga flava TaxID=1930060 RepID=A0AA37X8Y4_9MICO|nr:glycerophosphoryl diester phosphodiesterase membrane domain-containing protein [Arenivirga flava]GMA27974.1 membrane protein [Arenivirga flava]